jgi:CRISPR-associated protein Csx14
MSHQKYNEIFIFVSGSTPQIITETIFALSRQEPPVHPDEVYIITTAHGKKAVNETLLGAGILKQMCTEFMLPPIPLKGDSFLVIKDHDGSELEDIRNEDENRIAAEIITRLIREKTSSADNRLHCSIAGGRKTMSFYLGSILQLFGRKWDKLYHVLVTPEFEMNPMFYYKPRIDRTIQGRRIDDKSISLNTRDAEIELVSLPFIRLRENLTLLGQSFSELVEESQKEIDLSSTQPELTLNLSKRKLIVDCHAVKLTPIHMMLYAFIIRRKINCTKERKEMSCKGCMDCYFVLDRFSACDIETMKVDYSTISGTDKRWEIVHNTWKEGDIDAAVVRSHISKINSNITKEFQPLGFADLIVVSCNRVHYSSGYGIRLDKNKINII